MDEDRANRVDALDLRALLHRLNNQLAVILAHAELLEAKAPDQAQGVRAAHVVGATLNAITLTRSLRIARETTPSSQQSRPSKVCTSDKICNRAVKTLTSAAAK